MADNPEKQNQANPMKEIAENHFRSQKPIWLTRSALFAVFLFIAGCCLSCWISFLQHGADVNRNRDQVTLEIDHIRNNLSRELYATINLTQGLVALVRMQCGIRQDQFNAMARELTERSTLIRNVALAPGNVIRFIYPLAGNEKALGMDYLKVPDQAGAVLRAIQEKRTVLAGPLRLVQDGVGIIGRTPIFLEDSINKEKPLRYWGIAATVINFDTLVRAAGIEAAGANLRIALRGTDGTGARGRVFWGDSSVFALEPVLLEIALPSGSWQLAAMPYRGWPAFNFFTSASFLAGFFISLFFSLLLFETLRISQFRAFEIRRRQATEAVLWKKNRALRLFSQCNSAVVHATDERALLAQICRIAVDSAGYRLAWIGRAEHDEVRTVRPVTWAGPGEGFLDTIFVSWADNEHGRGTAGTAIRTRKPSIARDILNNPAFAVWHEVLLTRDFASAIAVPLIVGEEVYGVLLIYAAEPDAFDSTEVGLLDELGSNISHGMMAIRSRKERAEAIAALEAARNELEERVAQRTRELLRAKEAAESADRIKSAFLATMSHELRTPLNSIIGFTGIILQGLVGELTEEQRKQLNMVRDSAHHLLALINDVLDISKIEAGQLELRREDFVLQEAIEKSIQVVRPMAEKKSLPISAAVNPLSRPVYSDRRRVEQVLINLLSNAVKFTERGGITLTVYQSKGPRAADDKSDTTPGGDSLLKISITDTGIGIKAEDIDKLFKPFKQIDTGTTRRYEGTGLGLSLCKKLACMLGGDIEVQSDGPGKGSIFTFTLPMKGVRNG
jgi:signal transduction histidine kinase/sensor domain CHASE-containing protein